MRILTWVRAQLRLSWKKLKYLLCTSQSRVFAAVSLLVFSCEHGICQSVEHVCLHALCRLTVYVSKVTQNRSFRFFLVSLIVLNELSWPQHTLSAVTRSLEPSVTCLPGLPYTVCPQAVAAIWFTNESHLKVCPNFRTLRVSTRTQLTALAAFLKKYSQKFEWGK